MMDKAEMRALLKEERAGVKPPERGWQERFVQQHLAKMMGQKRSEYFSGLTGQPVCGTYYPVGDEISLLPLLDMPALSSINWSLPCVVSKAEPLAFREWKRRDVLAKGAYGIPAPSQSARQVEPDIVLVPLLGVDAQGFRIGYGGGFYDRTLARLRRLKRIWAVGVAFECQKVPILPLEPTDEPLDFLVTPSVITKFAN